MNRAAQILLFCCALLLVLALPGCTWKDTRTRVSYSAFEKYLDDNQVKEVNVGPDEVVATLQDGKIVVANRVPSDIAAELHQRGVEFSGTGALGNGSFGWLIWMIPLLFLLPLLLVRGGAAGAGGTLAMTKSKARVFAETDIKTTFNDIAGVDEAKEELKEIVAFLKDPKSYGRLGAHVPKGVLLVGPPGTGKTLLARIIHRGAAGRRDGGDRGARFRGVGDAVIEV
jgi:cell division protease FtsH